MKRNRHMHPSNKRLERWLDGADRDLDDHIESCLRCATRIEEIAMGETNYIAGALRQLLVVPTDLKPRLSTGIGRKMRARGDVELLGELLGVSWRTVRVLSQGTDIDG